MTPEVVVPLATVLAAAVPLQVEISVQFLAGVAGTILLMLLFLMVVVLWDIALALRDVAEKIDYLEDDVDSDLASINGTLTRIYDRMGGGSAGGRESVSGTAAGREAPSGPTAGREPVSGRATNVQGTDVVGGSVSASPGKGEPGDVRPGRVRAHAAGVNAAAGGTTTVNPTAGGAFDEPTTPTAGRRRVGTAPSAATAGTSTDALEDGEQTASGDGVESGRPRADAAPTDGAPSEGGVRTSVEEATDEGTSPGDSDDDGTTDDADDGGSTHDGDDGGSTDDDGDDGGSTHDGDDGGSTDDDRDGDGGGRTDVTAGAGPTAGGLVEGPATGGDETGPSDDARTRNVGRFASDGSGDSAWYDVTMTVPRAARTDGEDGASGAAASAEGATVDERLGSDEVQNAYVDPVSAFGKEDSDGESTVSLDDLGSRFQPDSTDTEADENAADASATDPDVARDDEGETVVDEPPSNTETAAVDAGAVDVGADDVDSDGDATSDATPDPGTEVVDVETMPSDAVDAPSVETDEADADEADADEGDTDEDDTDEDDTDEDDTNEDDTDGTDVASVDINEENDETHGERDETDGERDETDGERDETDGERDEIDGENDDTDDVDAEGDAGDADGDDPQRDGAASEDPGAVVADLSAAKARIRERHEDENGSLDYTSLQREAAATPGVKGSGMPAEEMLDALAAAAVHGLDDDGGEGAADVDAVEDALADRREETDEESNAGGPSDDVDGGAAREADDAADDTDDGGIADLVNRELDTLTQEVGGTSMTPDVSDADLDAAVDELDGDSYTFPLSGSSFDVTADVDSETATLSFTSEEPIDLGGARERLLTYQLRNYLDRDDTTHAELSVSDSAVVLDIPAADGPAVDAWADATVQIIDRTLYLSKDDD